LIEEKAFPAVFLLGKLSITKLKSGDMKLKHDPATTPATYPSGGKPSPLEKFFIHNSGIFIMSNSNC